VQNSYHSLGAKHLSLTWSKTDITHLEQNSYHSLGAKQLSLTWRKTAITHLLDYLQRVAYFSTLFMNYIILYILYPMNFVAVLLVCISHVDY